MAKKIIRKIVQLTITKEDWIRNITGGDEQLSYTIHGEVKNTGLSLIRNALVIGGIVNAKSRKIFQIMNNRFRIFKAADYSILPEIKPGDTAQFEMTITFPQFKELIFGRYKLRNLEDAIMEEAYKQKTYLIYDPKVLDETTQDWFKEELLKNLKLIGTKWEAMYDRDKNFVEYKCTGRIKNFGSRIVKEFYIEGSLITENNRLIKLTYEDNSYNLIGNTKIDTLEQYKSSEFELAIEIPSENILYPNNWSKKKLQDALSSEKVKTRIIVDYVDEVKSKAIYRDVEEEPSIIEESTGVKNIENIEESWVLDEDNDEYLISGILKNTGTQDVDNIYSIASIVDSESNDPIAWETAIETQKTLAIEKINFIAVDDEFTYAIRVKLPPGKLFGKNKWNTKNIQEGIASEKLKQSLELYYKKEDVNEEGVKRLLLGNSYFQLKNYRGCLREYTEGLRLQPDEKQFFFNIGLCYYKIGDTENAIENLHKAVQIDNEYDKAYYLFGLIYHSLEQYDNALQYYKKAYSINKENSRCMYNIGCVYCVQGNLSECIKWLKEALHIDRSMIISQIVRDPDLRKYMKNDQFSGFLSGLHEKSVGD